MATGSFENQPYMTRVEALSTEGALQILLNPDMERVSTAPAVLPRAGDVYVYVFNNYAKTEITKIRSDGYTWYSCSGKVVCSRATGVRIQKYYWTLQSADETGDPRFRRHEYRLEGEGAHSFVYIMHYLGDETVAVPRSVRESAGGRARNPAAQKPSRVSVKSVVSLVAAAAHLEGAASSGEECVDAAKQITEERNGFPPTSVMCAPRSIIRPNLKRNWQQTTAAGEMNVSNTKKVSKNNLLSQQVELTLDALTGNELINARDEIYDFLRKWDKD